MRYSVLMADIICNMELELEKSITVCQVKKRIERIVNIPAADMTLTREVGYVSGRRMKDHETIGSFDTHPLSFVVYSRGSKTIDAACMSGRTITVYAESWYGVDLVKALIEEESGIPIYSQELLYRNLVLRNTRMLSDYHILTMSVGSCQQPYHYLLTVVITDEPQWSESEDDFLHWPEEAEPL